MVPANRSVGLGSVHQSTDSVGLGSVHQSIDSLLDASPINSARLRDGKKGSFPPLLRGADNFFALFRVYLILHKWAFWTRSVCGMEVKEAGWFRQTLLYIMLCSLGHITGYCFRLLNGVSYPVPT